MLGQTYEYYLIICVTELIEILKFNNRSLVR